MACIMVSIMTVVVMLSRFAEIKKVMTDKVQSILLPLRVRSICEMKSKHPLFCNISTIVIVESRKRTISEALLTYFKKRFWKIYCFTAAEEAGVPSRNEAYSLAC